MPRNNQGRAVAPEKFTLPDDKIIVSRALLRQILECLLLTVPLFGAPRPPERQWSAIKATQLYRAKLLLREVLADGNNQRGDV